ncbi:LANO_0B02872g1_1 [Lachancea nothofagi CBS 11611]|uniref:LANO_0B02872g1_1 n=1 Tax=Lachancea nothofagi CBS 11611 TaxID=1266666 RepID=A0A1G4IWB2_9SACH|nr:LANO_0B02872g1_1 [Lachancea nothofagi CBS 11611]
METDKVPSISERLQLLMDENHDQVERPAGSLLECLIKSLEKERLTEEASVPRAQEEEVKTDVAGESGTAGSYYTSFVPPRPYADYFDFDGGQIEVDQNYESENEHNGVLNASAVFDTDKNDPYLSDDNDESKGLTTSVLPVFQAEESLDDTDQATQLVIDKLNTFKNEFRTLIQRIDEASLVSHMSTSVTALDPGSHMGPMNSMVGGILDTLQSLQPPSSRKRFRRDSEIDRASFKSPTINVSSREASVENIEEDACFGLPNFGVVLIKSPATVAQLWNEYTKLPSEWALPDWFDVVSQQHSIESSGIQSPVQLMKRRTSIRDLEKKYGSSWRNNDKNFSRQVNRRKKIWLAIEEGLEDDIPLQECFQLLESYVKERGKGLSWYYNGVPFKLIDLKLLH